MTLSMFFFLFLFFGLWIGILVHLENFYLFFVFVFFILDVFI